MANANASGDAWDGFDRATEGFNQAAKPRNIGKRTLHRGEFFAESSLFSQRSQRRIKICDLVNQTKSLRPARGINHGPQIADLLITQSTLLGDVRPEEIIEIVKIRLNR